MKLKDDANRRGNVLSKLQNILNNLDNIDAGKANRLVEWFVEKTSYYNKIENNLLFQRYPNEMQRGDIVLVQLGMNIFPELSDDDTGKHFCMIWAQQGQNFIIIPLTKHQQNSNKLSADLGVIPNMPNGVNTYAKIDAIRSVSIRRLYRIQGLTDGKIVTSKELQDKISNVILKEFIGFDKFIVDEDNLKAYNESTN